MESKLLSSLIEGEQQVKKLYRTWRSGYREDLDRGTMQVLQLCIDLTGYSYECKVEDLEDVANMDFVREKIIKSTYRETDVFSKPTVLKRLFQLVELMIAHDYLELLLNNLWLNKVVKLLVAFCESNDDECTMVTGYLSMVILLHLSVVRQHVAKQLEKTHSGESEISESVDSADKHDRYLLKVAKLLMRNVDAGCAYTATLPMITDLFCRMLEAFPVMYVVENSMLELLETFLQHRHNKMFHSVAGCLKNLLNPETQEQAVVEKVDKFFVDTLAKRFIQSMLNYKSSEKLALEVIVSVQRRHHGKSIFDEDVTEKIRQQMFHADEVIRGYALDFHVCTLCEPSEADSCNGEILQHILELYSRYDHSPDSLAQLVADLWQLEFFDDWSLLFDLLEEQAGRENNLFMMFSIVHVIKQCHALLISNLQQKDCDHSRLQSLLKAFLRKYPQALQKCAGYEQAFTVFLQPANSSFHALIKQYNINLEQYYEELFGVLEEVARTATNFYMLQKTLLVIRGYWDIILDVEQMWSELLQQYANEVFAARAQFNSRNIGKSRDLTEKYINCVTRMTAFLEMDYNVGSHLLNLANVVYNDFRLLERMQLDSTQTSMFWRLYKCTLYALITGLRRPEHCPEVVAAYQQTGRRLKKRTLELMRVLIKQLSKYDDPLDTAVHTFSSLCDMLLTTQPAIADLDIVELQDLVYPVEPKLLEKMAKFLLNYLFSKQYDWQDAPVIKQKLMLAKYIDVYALHKGLPRITDTHYIVANFSVDTQFDRHIKGLMKVLHHVDPTQFCEVICQAAFQLLLFYKSETSTKNFFRKFQSFALAKLTAASAEEYSSVFGRVVEKILNHLMNLLSELDTSSDTKRMLKLIEPLLPEVAIEERLMLENLILGHSEYNNLVESDRKAVDRFVKYLNKMNS